MEFLRNIAKLQSLERDSDSNPVLGHVKTSLESVKVSLKKNVEYIESTAARP
jgi:hypothetical protein